jgi:hypothetical protein
MPTTVKAQGRMTKDLVSPYRVGDRVTALVWDKQRGGCVHVGDRGTIRAIVIADPNDGDETFLMYDVEVPKGVVSLSAGEFEVWARR